MECIYIRFTSMLRFNPGEIKVRVKSFPIECPLNSHAINSLQVRVWCSPSQVASSLRIFGNFPKKTQSQIEITVFQLHCYQHFHKFEPIKVDSY